MKTKLFFTLLLTLNFFAGHLRAQDEECPVCGWYVDGIKIDTLSCYNFKRLTLVLPYNPAMDGYDEVVLRMAGNSDKTVPGRAVKTLVKNGYFILYVEGENIGNTYRLEPKTLINKKGTPAKNREFYGSVEGKSISGYTEKYDASRGGVMVRTPDYKYSSISKDYKLVCTNRVYGSGAFTLKEDPVDVTQKCNFRGKPVDFTNLDGNAAKSLPTATNPVVTTDASTTVPYTEKYPNGKLKVQGQKNEDGLQEGTWKYLDESGKLIRTEMYSNGMANGTWKYYKDGKVIKTETYTDGEKSE
jgi:hypothetical protein